MKQFTLQRLVTTLMVFVLSIVIANAQAPQKFSYQAAIRNNNNTPIANTAVSVKISLLKDSVTGAVVYSETHAATTNANGIVTLQIGGGVVVSGNFSSINWGSGNYYVKTETDPTGKSNYVNSGTAQLLSVPYALYAGASAQTNDKSSITTSNGKCVVVYTTTNAYANYQYKGGNGYWEPTNLGSAPLGAVSDSLSVVVYTKTGAYAFYQYQGGNGYWISTSISGTVLGALTTGQNIVVYTNTNAYAFYQYQNGNGYWTSTSISGTPIGAAASGQNIVVYTSTNAYSFYQYQNGNGYWTSTSLSGTPIGIISAH
jgi:hypothetical protein